MNSRIRFPFYVLFLNLDYVAARSLRSLHSKYMYQTKGMQFEKKNTEYINFEVLFDLK